MLKPAAFTLALIAAPLLAASEPDSATPDSTAGSYVGTETCASCHKDEHENWQGSHHDLAMQLPTQSTVLGNFDDSSFDYNGVTTTFSRDGQRFMVRTDNAAGELEDFEVAYVFGVYPLQQYLLPMSGGRLQLGIGIGWLKEEFEVLGVPWERRAARTEEYVEVMRALWAEDNASFDGEFVSFEGMSSNLVDSHPPKFFRWKNGKRPTRSRYADFPRLD